MSSADLATDSRNVRSRVANRDFADDVLVVPLVRIELPGPDQWFGWDGVACVSVSEG